jgi:DNA-binding MarR family transcriptional regulator
MFAIEPDRLFYVIRETILTIIRHDGTDLTARQLAVLLTAYLTKGPHTVSSLAAELNVSVPAITRVLDQLGELDLTRRSSDPFDRRSVHVQQTAAGQTYLRNLRSTMTAVMHTGRVQAGALNCSRHDVEVV